MGCLGGYTPCRITAGKWQLREGGDGWEGRREIASKLAPTKAGRGGKAQR